MFAMPLGRRQALFALVFSILLLLGGFTLLRAQGLLVLSSPFPSEPAAEADMPYDYDINRHILATVMPLCAQEPQSEPTAQGAHGRVFALHSTQTRISGGGELNSYETDANGNPVLGGTYVLSVPFAFALGDIPI